MAIVESVVSVLVERLGDQLIQEVNLLRGEREQVEWVKREFRRMESFLKDMDARVEEHERAKTWRQEVRDSAYRAEDIIDTFFLEIAPLRRRHGFLGTVKRYAFFFNELMARRKLLSEIEKLKIELESITKNRAPYGIEYRGHGEATSSTGQSQRKLRLSSPNIEEPDFTGFDEDVKTLIRRLTRGEQRRCVVGVVGMGGLGKTTLVRKVYKSDVVKRQFHPCVWLSISQVYAVKELLQAVIRSCMVLSEEDHKKLGRMNDSELSKMISNYLAGKTYLIVLDDVWKPGAWEALKHAFPDTNNGSRVLLTTRNKEIALQADARNKPHELRFLTEPESWELFCKKAFPGQNASFSQDTEELGRKIVRKCHRLPLAIIVIGGLLARKEAMEWENVYKSINWQFVEGEIQISGILALSYKDLPYDLKPCFLYLGNFPGDYEFGVKKLVRLWAAEGFLHQRGDATLEAVGEDCLKELIQRSLVQVARRSSTTGAVKSCRIHDLLRDVCTSEGKEEKFLEIDGGDVPSAAAAPSFSPFRARRLAIHHNGSLVHSSQNLRSILIYGGTHEWLAGGEEKLLSRSLKLLRVLDLNEVTIENLPSEIGELIHLRYLACSLSSFGESTSLPSSIGNLTNLQTLFLTSNYRYLKIPSTIENMKQLRHLRVKGGSLRLRESLAGPPSGLLGGQPRLHHLSPNLCTLADVSAGKWLCSDCLGEMRNLRKLGIKTLSRETDVGRVWEFIVKLESLESLFVRSREYRENLLLGLVPLNHLRRLSKLYLFGKLEKPPESSYFPLNLTKLTLRDSSLEQDPLPTLEKLENLQILELGYSSYLGKEMACSAGGFPQLKSLTLESLHALEEWRLEEGSTPRLSHLRIFRCPLKMVPEGLQHVTSLKTLEIWGMNEAFYSRVKRAEDEDWHKIQHIPSVQIERSGPSVHIFFPL